MKRKKFLTAQHERTNYDLVEKKLPCPLLWMEK